MHNMNIILEKKISNIIKRIIKEQEENQNDEFDDEDDIENSFVSNNNILSKLFEKWKNESPSITYRIMMEAKIFFDRKKNHLNPDMREVKSFYEAFSQFPSNDIQKLRDIQNYTWEQIEYLMDRFGKTHQHFDQVDDFDVNKEFPTIEEKINYHIENWKKSPYKVLDQDNLIIIKITSEANSKLYGSLDHILIAANSRSRSPWCTSTQSGNMFNSYRNDGRSFYYCLDLSKPKNDNDFIFSIDVREGYSRYNYTPRDNGTQSISEETLLQYHPNLKNHLDVFQPFRKTKEEEYNLKLDNITFIKNHPNDFVTLPTIIQKRYIEARRNINSERAIKTLSKSLINLYVALTNEQNIENRFVNSDNNNPFGVINNIPTQSLKYLDKILRERLRYTNGLLDLKIELLQSKFGTSYVDIENNIALISSYKSINKRSYLYKREIDSDREIRDLTYGVVKIGENSAEVIKSVNYKNTFFPKPFNIKKDEDSGKLIKHFYKLYVNVYDENDYFYWRIDDNKGLNTKFLTKEQGDNELNRR